MITLRGPLAGAVLVVLGLYMLLAPIERLARKPSPVRRTVRRSPRKESFPLWMTLFFRGLGLLLVALGGLLLAPLASGA